MWVSDLPENSDLLLLPRYYRKIALALIGELVDTGYQLEDLAEDPFGTLQRRTDIEVVAEDTLGNACHVDARYDDRYTPPVIHVRQSRTERRNNFSILHELAHHIQANSDTWADLAYSLRSDLRSRLKEQVADSIAANLLLPDELVDECIGDSVGVSAKGVRLLYERSQASISACLVRSLDRPGERVVMLADHDGNLYFSGTSDGGLIQPSKNKAQTDLRTLFKRTIDNDENTANMAASVGFEYLSGATYTNIRYEGALIDLNLIVTATRANNEFHAWGAGERHTGSICLHEFDIASSTGRCSACSEHLCPKCGQCTCPDRTTYCSSCFLALSKVLASTGASTCDECS